ncbi:hypothetical protein [Sphingomonas solaris]|uniref:Uncharacterized protein n=1 Tax=Alterirhizorhabdus solaris TaxID=2529389 RepID=A0A558RC93_9SPHN|nr:hypothetical protein [Sphingomonas solaris]TVV76961.1 hypothetical protein FOY91_02660 [Sphingomonas solaris]
MINTIIRGTAPTGVTAQTIVAPNFMKPDPGDQRPTVPAECPVPAVVSGPKAVVRIDGAKCLELVASSLSRKGRFSETSGQFGPIAYVTADRLSRNLFPNDFPEIAR